MDIFNKMNDIILILILFWNIVNAFPTTGSSYNYNEILKIEITDLLATASNMSNDNYSKENFLNAHNTFVKFKQILEEEIDGKQEIAEELKTILKREEDLLKELKNYVNIVISDATQQHRLYKRDAETWVSNAVDAVKTEITKSDPGTIIKRIGEGYEVYKVASSFSNPISMVVNVLYTIGKMIIGDTMASKLSEWWHNTVG